MSNSIYLEESGTEMTSYRETETIADASIDSRLR
jgi:hypothetical protein